MYYLSANKKVGGGILFYTFYKKTEQSVNPSVYNLMSKIIGRK